MGYPWIVIPLFFLSFLGSAEDKPKTVKGTVTRDATLINVGRGVLCTIDSGGSEVLQVAYEHENPLFESKSPNRVNAFLEFRGGIESGRKYTLPDSQVVVCYYEKGDLLMFHTFSSEGSIQLDWGKDSTTMSGSIDLKFVRPHHNMSNSDYHYIGGKLQVRVTK